MPTSTTQPILVAPQTGPNSGSAMGAAIFNALVVGQSCLLTGTPPASSASLVLALPQLQVLVNAGGTATYLTMALTNLTITGGASTDNFIYISTLGIYSQVAAAAAGGANRPADPAGTMCLGYATTNNTNTLLTSFTLLATGFAMTASAIAAADETPSNAGTGITASLQDTIHHAFYQIAHVLLGFANLVVDSTEAVTADALGGGTGLSNMDRIRHVESVLLGGASMATMVANTKAAILQDGSQSANLVTLSGRLIQSGAPPGSGAQALHLLGNGSFSGQNGNGTGLAVALPSGSQADIFNFVRNNVSQMRGDYAGHLISGGSTMASPTKGLATVIGNSSTLTITRGNDMAGLIHFVTGATGLTGSGVWMTVNFTTAYPSAPSAVLLTPSGGSGWASSFTQPIVQSVTTAGFNIFGPTQLGAGLTYDLHYLVIG